MSEQDATTPRGPESYSGRDTAADPLEAMPDDRRPAGDHVPEQTRTANAIPGLVLAVVAFTVFDGVIVVAYVTLWAMDLDLLLTALEGRGWISLLLAVSPLILGAIVVQRNKSVAVQGSGTIWANAGIVVGTLMGLITLAVPILATLAQMMSPCGE